MRDKAQSWGEKLAPPATASELKEFSDKVLSRYSINLPEDYISFLRIVNGLEFNGLVIYGTKNSELDPAASPLDFFEMNESIQKALKARAIDVVAIGEDSTGVITYEKRNDQFQYRDRIGLDRSEPFLSFEDMLKVEIYKVLD